MTNSADPDQLASQKPTDLDLHCLLRQGMLCSAREGLRWKNTAKWFCYNFAKEVNFVFQIKFAPHPLPPRLVFETFQNMGATLIKN